MRIFLIISILILGHFSISAQNKANIKSLKNMNGEIRFELQIENQTFHLDKMRSINENLMNNSTKFAEELILSFSK